MSTDLGAFTKEAKRISRRSRAIACSIVKGNTPEDRIRQRCVIATGDPEFARLMRFCNNPVKAGIEAIKRGVDIFTDIRMAQVGITKIGHRCDIRCVLDSGIKNEERTRTSSGFFAVKHKLSGAIIVIGNAPSAAITVCDMIKKGLKPALLIATPVGFVNATEAKERVRRLEIPSITCIGTKGGTPVAVAVVNELVEMAIQKA